MRPRARRSAALVLAWPWLLAPATAQEQPASADEIVRTLRAHPHYSKLALERVEAPAPYVFLFQPAPAAAPQRAADLVAKLVPFLEGTRAVFEREIAAPNGLARRPGRELFPVVVLATRVALVSCQAATRSPTHLGALAVHDPGLNACVLYDEVGGDERPWLERVRAARHVLLHACQQAWYAAEGAPPLQHWLHEGMADALANTGADPSLVRSDPQAVRRCVADMQDPVRALLGLRTLAELFSVGEPARLDALLPALVPRRILSSTPLDRASFHRQASLLCASFWSGESARLRPALVAFVGDALRGHGGAGEFRARFAPATEAELEQGFLNWVLAEHKRAFPSERVDVERARRAFARGEATGIAPDPPALDLADASPEERLAKAIWDFARGAEDAGVKALEALLAGELDQELRQRIEREQRRFRAWRALRDAHLADLAASRALLSFSVAGKTHQARVLAFADGAVVLEPNRSGKERLAAGELDALALAQEIRPRGRDDWARLVPYALREDPRTRRLLEPDEGEAGALLEDVRTDYPARLRLGRMLARIEALGNASRPDTRAEAETLLTEARALRSEGADVPAVQRKERALLESVRTWLVDVVDLLEPPELFGGTLEVLEGERVRLVYDFDEPRELDDFEACAYPVHATSRFPPLDVESRPFHLNSGRLVAIGNTALRSRFELAAPTSVRYRLAFGKELRPPANPYFYLGIADDRAEHFVAAINFRTLLSIDGSKVVQESGKGDALSSVELGSVYELELVHDGKTVALRCRGQETVVPAGQRQAGALFLRAHSAYPVQVLELVIEGRLPPAAVAAMRKARVERELATF